MGAGFEIHHDLQASVQKASDLSITTSCTLRVNDDTFCVHDGIWRDCGLGLSQRSHTDEDIKRPQPWHAFIFENIWILWFYDNIIILTLNYHFKYIWTWIVYIINIEMCETAKCDIKWAHSQAAAARIWLHASRRRSVASPEIRRKATFALLKKLQENCDVCFLYDVCIIYIYIYSVFMSYSYTKQCQNIAPTCSNWSGSTNALWVLKPFPVQTRYGPLLGPKGPAWQLGDYECRGKSQRRTNLEGIVFRKRWNVRRWAGRRGDLYNMLCILFELFASS